MPEKKEKTNYKNFIDELLDDYFWGLYENPSLDFLKGSKTRREAENRIRSKYDEKGVEYFNDIIKRYNINRPELTDEDLLNYNIRDLGYDISQARKLPLNIETWDANDVHQFNDALATYLGMSPNDKENAYEKFYNEYYGSKGALNAIADAHESLDGYDPDDPRNIALRNEILKRVVNGQKTDALGNILEVDYNIGELERLQKALGFLPFKTNGDNLNENLKTQLDYILDLVPQIANRGFAMNARDDGLGIKALTTAENFLFPFVGEKLENGREPNGVDFGADAASLALNLGLGGATIPAKTMLGKLGAEGLKNLGLAVGEQGLDVLHTATDPDNKEFYSFNPNDESGIKIDFRGDPSSLATNILLGSAVGSIANGTIGELLLGPTERRIVKKIKSEMGGTPTKKDKWSYKTKDKNTGETIEYSLRHPYKTVEGKMFDRMSNDALGYLGENLNDIELFKKWEKRLGEARDKGAIINEMLDDSDLGSYLLNLHNQPKGTLKVLTPEEIELQKNIGERLRNWLLNKGDVIEGISDFLGARYFYSQPFNDAQEKKW